MKIKSNFIIFFSDFINLLSMAKRKAFLSTRYALTKTPCGGRVWRVPTSRYFVFAAKTLGCALQSTSSTTGGGTPPPQRGRLFCPLYIKVYDIVKLGTKKSNGLSAF